MPSAAGGPISRSARDSSDCQERKAAGIRDRPVSFLPVWQANGLHPLCRHPNRMLLRRATFDLIGLPPTPG